MRNYKIDMAIRDRLAGIVTRTAVKNYLTEVRNAIRERRSITGVGLLVPDVMLDMIREEAARDSRLLPFVNHRTVNGTARVPITGAIPEAVWTEMCANLNEMSLTLNQVEVDGYKVGAYIPVCNAVIEDSDVALANEIVSSLGAGIAKALDKAILFGTGTKMPTGIVTRLAQTAQPDNWGVNAPAWVDLHTSNILTLDINSTHGAEFFEALVGALGTAKPVYSSDGLFWAMNRKTHLDLRAKSLAYASDGALIAATPMMPILGGSVVEFTEDEIADGDIIGGYGANYLLAERAGMQFAASDAVRFLQDQTVFKGTARYDGMPVGGKAFVIVNYKNTAPTTTKSFAPDVANQ